MQAAEGVKRRVHVTRAKGFHGCALPVYPSIYLYFICYDEIQIYHSRNETGLTWKGGLQQQMRLNAEKARFVHRNQLLEIDRKSSQSVQSIRKCVRTLGLTREPH